MSIEADWERLQRRVESLAERAERDLESVAGELGGLTISADPLRSRRALLVEAIASAIIPPEFNWFVSEDLGGGAHLVCSGYEP